MNSFQKFCFVVSLVLIVGCNFSFAGTPRENAFKICEKSVVQVEREKNGQTWRGGGFLMPDGYIVTNAHVVGNLPDSLSNYKEITLNADIDAIYRVTFGKKIYKAHVVGRDTTTDLAILRTQEDELLGMLPVKLGNSQSVQVGHQVITCGSPLSDGISVTQGIISALRRNSDLVTYGTYFQIDAAVNPGNSGGPLVSLETGEVIGVVNSKIPGKDNIAFAVRIEVFNEIKDELTKGTLHRGFLGLKVSQDWKEQSGFSGLEQFHKATDIDDIASLQNMRNEIFVKGGVLVVEVMRMLPYDPKTGQQNNPNVLSPAYVAGIRKACVLKCIDKQEISNSFTFIQEIAKTRPDVPVTLSAICYMEGKETKHEEKTFTVLPTMQLPDAVRKDFF